MPPRLNIPPITRFALIVLVFQSTLSAGIRYRQSSADTDLVVPYLALVPQMSLIFPWTFVVTTLVENNIFTFAIAVLTLFYGGRYLERAWTSAEFARFLLIVSLIPNVITFGMLVTMFAITGDMGWTLTSINGCIPLQISFLVAFSQLLPAHTVTLFKGIVSLRVPRFPLIHILAVTILALTPLLSVSSFLLVNTAFLTSWTYLRFYKSALPDLESSQPSSLRGDPSESFAFAEFFPDPVKPGIAAFSRRVFNLMVSLHLCKPFSLADISASRGESMLQRGPGGARAEAERRRAVALKALDQRLNAATGPSGSKPSPQPTTNQPSVQIQSQPNAQPEMLGETSYVPEREDGKQGP